MGAPPLQSPSPPGAVQARRARVPMRGYERAKAVAQVTELLARGHDPETVARQLMAMYGVGPGRAKRLIESAYIAWDGQARWNRSRAFDRALAGVLAAWRRAWALEGELEGVGKVAALRLALDCLDRYARLFGLDRIKVNVEAGDSLREAAAQIAAAMRPEEAADLLSLPGWGDGARPTNGKGNGKDAEPS